MDSNAQNISSIDEDLYQFIISNAEVWGGWLILCPSLSNLAWDPDPSC